MHALWNCEKFQQVWAKNFGQVDRDKAASGSFSDLVKLIQDKPQAVPLFVVIAWAIWYQKKKSHLQKASLSLDRIANFAKQYLHDFKSSENTPAQTRLLSLRKWSPLVSGISRQISMVQCLMKSILEWSFATLKVQSWLPYRKKIKKPSSVVALELLAARRAMSFVLEANFHQSSFEGDSETVIQSLCGDGLKNSYVGHIIRDTLSYANSLQVSLSLMLLGKIMQLHMPQLREQDFLSLYKFEWSLFLLI